MSKQGFIYVAVQKDVPGYCKVGQTVDPDTREKTLGGSGLAEIDIIESVLVEDMDAVEAAFHKILPPARRRGEWFNIETERVLPMLRCLGRTQEPQEREPRAKRTGQAPRNRSEATSDLSGKTPQAEFCQLIVDVLEELGGRGRAKDVTAQIGERVQLRTGDLEQYESGQVVWKISVAWARQKLKDEGILKPDSAHGWWELAKTPSGRASSRKRRKPSQTNSGLPGTTPPAEFRQHIVDVLKELGGSGRTKDVTAHVGERVQLRSGDLERRKDGQLVWENAVAWARLKLKQEGILKSESPWGVWELA